MENQQLINAFWDESIKGINQEVLDDGNLWYSYVLNLPIEQQVIYTIGVLNQQVNNGGFHQYFLNTFGQFAYLTLDNLNLIKAFETEKLLESAVNAVNYEGYELNEFREKICEGKLSKIVDFDDKLCEYLNGLDTKYYALEEDFEKLFMDFLSKIN